MESAAKKPFVAFYDDQEFDYQSWWKGRRYEDLTEKAILCKFLQRLTSQRGLNTVLDIGAGFGRLAPVYLSFVKKAILLEPSQKLIQQGKRYLRDFKGWRYVCLPLEKVEKLPGSFDLAIMVRVAHHLTDLKTGLGKVKKKLRPGGFLILSLIHI